jgi:hypothetical protein
MQLASSERSRSTLYHGLTDLIEDEEAVGEIVSFSPASDVDGLATEDVVSAEVAGSRADRIEQMAAMQRTYIRWTLGALVSLVGVMVAMGFLRSP